MGGFEPSANLQDVSSIPALKTSHHCVINATLNSDGRWFAAFEKVLLL